MEREWDVQEDELEEEEEEEEEEREENGEEVEEEEDDEEGRMMGAGMENERGYCGDYIRQPPRKTSGHLFPSHPIPPTTIPIFFSFLDTPISFFSRPTFTQGRKRRIGGGEEDR
ncbi:hypothetical protein M0802_013234 [Mischocyttarus mexicanus]|nr:hypothetical protein M0802_013234 [Mischocyttarus mexicanus]